MGGKISIIGTGLVRKTITFDAAETSVVGKRSIIGAGPTGGAALFDAEAAGVGGKRVHH